MAEAEKIRVELGFEGGPGLTVLVDGKTAEELERVLANGKEDSFTFDAEDGRYTVAVRKVVFAKRFARESRVGFGAGG